MVNVGKYTSAMDPMRLKLLLMVQKSGRSPVERTVVNNPLFTGRYTSQVVVWDFFHQQYHQKEWFL